MRDPEKTIPRSLLLGTALVTLLYLALNAVFVFAAPMAELAGKLDVGRIAARAIGGAVLEEAVAGLIALALVSSVSSLVMAGPRVYAQMAADGVLPRGLAVTSGPPRAAIALQAGLALFFLWSATFDALLTWIGFTLSISTAATVAALIVLRKREGNAVCHTRLPRCPLALSGRGRGHDSLHRDAKADGEPRGFRHDRWPGWRRGESKKKVQKCLSV